ncbi:MAG: ATP-binding protein [Firmicutes bacterium]|nr:ATP-binding protein [Bacillota bacterium]
MRELSLHILDIAQNSIAASASLVEIRINEDPARDLLIIEIYDNGQGIAEKQLAQITDPFFTSRTTREVGLGLALFAQAAARANGSLKVDSTVGEGTRVLATFSHSHLDRAPLGDLVGTLLGLIVLNPEIDVVYQHNYNDKTLLIDTRRIKSELGGIVISHPAVTNWLRGFIQEGLDDLYGGE